VRYKRHISVVYSDRPSCEAACSYEIIHASGNQCLDIDGNSLCDEGEPFNRKTVVNSTQFFLINDQKDSK